MVQKAHFDLIFMDIQMPEMDGYEATEEIRKWEMETGSRGNLGQRNGNLKSEIPISAVSENRNYAAGTPVPRIPIIAMTAHAMGSEREKCLGCGMDDFISKPIDPETLLSVLSRWIRSQRHSREDTVHDEITQQDRGTGRQGFSFSPPGIDTRAGLKRVAGNQTLFRKLLAEFYQDYRDAVPKIKDMLEHKNAEELRRLSHTLKGVAGNMGAQELFLAAGQMEAAIREDRTEEYSALGEKLEKELSHVLLFIKTLAEMPNAETSERSPDKEESPAQISDLISMLNELGKLLQEGDAEVLEKAESVKAYLKKCDLTAAAEQLGEQIYNYEFGEARESLEKILETLQNRKCVFPCPL
ncbi:MAG: response regulator [Desulfobacterales bacterium]